MSNNMSAIGGMSYTRLGAEAQGKPNHGVGSEAFIAVGKINGRGVRMAVTRSLPLEEFFAFVSDAAKEAWSSDESVPQVAEITIDMHPCRTPDESNHIEQHGATQGRRYADGLRDLVSALSDVGRR